MWLRCKQYYPGLELSWGCDGVSKLLWHVWTCVNWLENVWIHGNWLKVRILNMVLTDPYLCQRTDPNLSYFCHFVSLFYLICAKGLLPIYLIFVTLCHFLSYLCQRLIPIYPIYLIFVTLCHFLSYFFCHFVSLFILFVSKGWSQFILFLSLCVTFILFLSLCVTFYLIFVTFYLICVKGLITIYLIFVTLCHFLSYFCHFVSLFILFLLLFVLLNCQDLSYFCHFVSLSILFLSLLCTFNLIGDEIWWNISFNLICVKKVHK